MRHAYESLSLSSLDLVPQTQNRGRKEARTNEQSRSRYSEGTVRHATRRMSIFFQPFSIGHLTTVAKLFRHAQRKAGLPENLVLYCGRQDYGTRVLKNTSNLAAVMKTTDHRDVKKAMQYQHPELEIVRAALDQGRANEAKA